MPAFDFKECAQPFSFRFLQNEEAFETAPPPYEYELLSAEEKAAYFDELAKNKGQENTAKIARSCRKKAAKLLEQAERLDPEEAKPLVWKARGLNSLAQSFEDRTPPEVIEAQREIGIEAVQECRGLRDGEDAVDEKGFPNLQPAPATSASKYQTAQQKKRTKKALFWKNIHQWSVHQAMAYYSCGPTKPSDWDEAIFVRAQKDPLAVALMKAGAARPMFRLLELANMGNPEAARSVVQFVEELVRTLDLYAKTNPEPFQQAARSMTHWPVMHSPHPKRARSFAESS